MLIFKVYAIARRLARVANGLLVILSQIDDKNPNRPHTGIVNMSAWNIWSIGFMVYLLASWRSSTTRGLPMLYDVIA